MADDNNRWAQSNRTSRTRRVRTAIGTSDVDAMIIDAQTRKFDTELVIPETSKFLLTTDSAFEPTNPYPSQFNSVNERYFDRPEVIASYKNQSLIETPDVEELGDLYHGANRLRHKGNQNHGADLSDGAFERRHRKYENFEKSQRLREKERLKYEHYKLKERIEQLRGLDASTFLALPATTFSQRQETDGDGESLDEGERRRQELIETAEALEARYRALLPPDRSYKKSTTKTKGGTTVMEPVTATTMETVRIRPLPQIGKRPNTKAPRTLEVSDESELSAEELPSGASTVPSQQSQRRKSANGLPPTQIIPSHEVTPLSSGTSIGPKGQSGVAPPPAPIELPPKPRRGRPPKNPQARLQNKIFPSQTLPPLPQPPSTGGTHMVFSASPYPLQASQVPESVSAGVPRPPITRHGIYHPTPRAATPLANRRRTSSPPRLPSLSPLHHPPPVKIRIPGRSRPETPITSSQQQTPSKTHVSKQPSSSSIAPDSTYQDSAPSSQQLEESASHLPPQTVLENGDPSTLSSGFVFLSFPPPEPPVKYDKSHPNKRAKTEHLEIPRQLSPDAPLSTINTSLHIPPPSPPRKHASLEPTREAPRKPPQKGALMQVAIRAFETSKTGRGHRNQRPFGFHPPRCFGQEVDFRVPVWVLEPDEDRASQPTSRATSPTTPAPPLDKKRIYRAKDGHSWVNADGHPVSHAGTDEEVDELDED